MSQINHVSSAIQGSVIVSIFIRNVMNLIWIVIYIQFVMNCNCTPAKQKKIGCMINFEKLMLANKPWMLFKNSTFLQLIITYTPFYSYTLEQFRLHCK